MKQPEKSKRKSLSGPTVSEADRREKGQTKILLRLSPEDTEHLKRKREGDETAQSTIRRLIRPKSKGARNRQGASK